jgi:hypothetical protein
MAAGSGGGENVSYLYLFCWKNVILELSKERSSYNPESKDAKTLLAGFFLC